MVDDSRAGFVQGSYEGLITLENILNQGSVLPVNLQNVLDKLLGHLKQKIDYLEKIIKVVGMQLNTLVEAKPAKIVAGFFW